MTSRFQVDLKGVIELLSRHLYSAPSVFVRELLQNGVDAIAARRTLDPGHVGGIRIELIEAGNAPATLLFQDDGIGLTEAECHQFLATIGQSSKRGEMFDRPQDFLGQFGIGLLSCFMVTDEIVVISQSAREGNPPIQWKGNSNGTYALKTLDQPAEPGTQVYLRANSVSGDLLTRERLLQLLTEYGQYLRPEIQFTAGGATERINAEPPWEQSYDKGGRDQLLTLGGAAFEREFLDAIPLQSFAGNVEGTAFVLAQPVHASARQSHRVYLKNMLLSAKSHDVLPDWAFFVQCILNARELRPTASRESFFADQQLEKAREELGECLRGYLMELARRQPDRFSRLLSIHHKAVKSLAAVDDECLELFADWLPFETTAGRMTLGEFRQANPVIRYARTVDQFRQIAQVAASESIAVINAGYVDDAEILERLGALHPEMQVELFKPQDLSDRFEELSHQERESTLEFERLADVTLQKYKCMAEISKFQPVEMPVLYVQDDNAAFLRSVEQAQEESDELWGGVLGSLAENTIGYARLHMNLRNPLVRRVSSLGDRTAQQRCVEMLYIQALLLGHYPLQEQEIRLLNHGLLGLIDWAVSVQGDG